jgi:Protein of unknown function (DUF4242)
MVFPIRAISVRGKLSAMSRYLVEREFAQGLAIPRDEAGAALCHKVVAANAEDEVTWIHSYVTADGKRTFCIYDAPTPQAIRRAASAMVPDAPLRALPARAPQPRLAPVGNNIGTRERYASYSALW